MFTSKKIKTASQVIANFTQQFKDIVEHQEVERSRAQEELDIAINKKQAAQDEITLASNAITKIEDMFK